MEATRYFEARNDNKTLIIDDSYKNFALKEIISPVKYSIKDEYQLVNYDTTALNTIFTGVAYIMINVKPFNTENLLAIACDVDDVAYATYIHDDILTIYILRIGGKEDSDVNDAKYVAEHTKILHYVPSELINRTEHYGVEIFNKSGKIIFSSAFRYLKIIDTINQDIDDVSDINRMYGGGIAVIPFSCRYTASYNPQMVVYWRHFFSFEKSGDVTKLSMVARVEKTIPPFDNYLLTGYFYNTNLMVLKGE